MFRSGVDDADVNLMRNEQVDIGGRQAGRVEGTIGGFGHGAHGVLEHFTP